MRNLWKQTAVAWCLIAGAVFCHPTTAAEPFQADALRVWKDDTGKYSVEARLSELQDDAVVLETADGKSLTVPITRLSHPDQVFLRRAREEQAEQAARAKGPQYGPPQSVFVRLGLEVTAQGGPCKNLLCTFPVPMDWPEQKVTVIKEEISPAVRGTNTRTLNGTVEQFEFRVPRLPAGQTARVALTLQLDRRYILPPPDPNVFRFAQIDTKLRPYLGESPMIETKHDTVRAAAAEIELDPALSPWKQVETIYDWTRDRVQSDGTKPLKGALAALVTGTGDCEERTSLFVAMCRLKQIPARSVWIDGHTYPEFYLEDDLGNGHWIPCESLGARIFGGVQHVAPLLQKGDNFRMSQKDGPQRYVAPTCSCKLSADSGTPVIREIRERLDGNEPRSDAGELNSDSD